MCLIFLFLFSAVLLPHSGFCQAEELMLDGVMYESNSPNESIAFINGKDVVVGDAVDSFIVKEIKQHQVVLQAETGDEMVLHVDDPRKLSAQEKLEQEQKRRALEAQKLREEKSELIKLHAQEKAEGGTFLDSFSMFFNKMRFVSTIMDLKKVQMAALIYESDHGSVNDLMINQLIEADFLPLTFADGKKGGYFYSIESSQKGLMITADPVNPESKNLHFMIDSHGSIYAESGSPATFESLLYS